MKTSLIILIHFLFSWRLGSKSRGVEKRDKRQCKDVREWQETWIYCCVAFITDEGLCARLMCSCAHQTPSGKLDVVFLCNPCVYVHINMGFKFQGQDSTKSKKKRRRTQTARQITSCWLDILAFVFITASCLSLIIDILLCVLYPFSHIFKWHTTTPNLQFNVWFMVSILPVTLFQ